MIKVNLIGLRRDEKIVDENSSISSVLEEAGLLIPGNDYSLNLARIPESNIHSTFADYGIENGDTCTLTSIAQKNNA